MFDYLFKAALSVVTVPVAVAADVVTMGGVISDHDGTYTGEAISDLMDNLKNATDPKEK
jgi:hypothetical protein